VTGVAMMHGGNGGMGTWGGAVLLWLLIGLAFLVLVVVATIWLVRNMSGGDTRGDARRELDLRYARGDLTSDEYNERRERLGA
jgi:putative membrane protein